VTIKTGDAYREGLRRLRPNVFKWGELVEDVTTHPATRLHVQSVAASYDALAGALTDAKGHRALRASRQPDGDAYLHVKEVRDDGIVVRGVKAQIRRRAPSTVRRGLASP
jgi:aromatic ring hydroxylase